MIPASREVIFTGHDDRYPLPDPDLLRLHAAVAKILDVSGMGHMIEEVLHKRQEVRRLDEDGSTDMRIFMAAF